MASDWGVHFGVIKRGWEVCEKWRFIAGDIIKLNGGLFIIFVLDYYWWVWGVMCNSMLNDDVTCEFFWCFSHSWVWKFGSKELWVANGGQRCTDVRRKGNTEPWWPDKSCRSRNSMTIHDFRCLSDSFHYSRLSRCWCNFMGNFTGQPLYLPSNKRDFHTW